MKTVFLGGTCNGSNWRERLIPLLNIAYFNPVVDEWTEKCLAEELHKRESCDFCLYVITPKLLGTYSIAELVDDSNKRPQKTLLVLLKNDGDIEFAEFQWRSLNAVGRLVEKNGAQVFSCLEEAASYLNGIKR
ncbi:MAG: hypothetical protein HRT88_09075 [Lentisphaeraceae bacterium]|nr:hypothetical protein [Lentisphaeraceae bacterium]